MKQAHTINRRASKKIFVGNVAIGGDAPISVQSMTNTDTCDIDTTVKTRSIDNFDLLRFFFLG